MLFVCFFFSSRRRHTRCALVTGVQTCALPISLAYADFKDLKLDSEGNFDVILSAERPANYTGDWWKLEPATEKLMVRQVASDWGKEVDPTLSIERLDTTAAKPQLSAAEMSARLEIGRAHV